MDYKGIMETMNIMYRTRPKDGVYVWVLGSRIVDTIEEAMDEVERSEDERKECFGIQVITDYRNRYSIKLCKIESWFEMRDTWESDLKFMKGKTIKELKVRKSGVEIVLDDRVLVIPCDVDEKNIGVTGKAILERGGEK